jgi:hypothetical protein
MQKFESHRRPFLEYRRALAADQREKGQVQFIHQIMSQQIVLEKAEQNHPELGCSFVRFRFV